MIGQDKLINKIDKLTLDTLPHSLLLIGDEGSGKHSLCNIIIGKFNLSYFDITDKISLDIINEIYEKVEPYIYMIDLDKVLVKQENVILKILEEPFNNAYFILFSTNKNSVIPTILNRCQVWELEKYSEETLRYFLTTVTDDYPNYFYLTPIFPTPGQLLYVVNNHEYINDMIKLIKLFIEHVGTANFANTLTISNKLAYKDEQGKWSYNIFIKILAYIIKKQIVDNYDQKLYNLYIETENLLKNSNISHINKQYLFENYLLKCKYLMKV